MVLLFINSELTLKCNPLTKPLTKTKGLHFCVFSLANGSFSVPSSAELHWQVSQQYSCIPAGCIADSCTGYCVSVCVCCVIPPPLSFPSVFKYSLFISKIHLFKYPSRLLLVLVHTRRGSQCLCLTMWHLGAAFTPHYPPLINADLLEYSSFFMAVFFASHGNQLPPPLSSGNSCELVSLFHFPFCLPPLERNTSTTKVSVFMRRRACVHFACVGEFHLPVWTALHPAMNGCLYKITAEIWFSAFWWTKTYMKINTKDKHKTGWLIKSSSLLAIIYCLVSGELYIYANLSASGSILDSKTKWIKVVCFANECKWPCLWGAL